MILTHWFAFNGKHMDWNTVSSKQRKALCRTSQGRASGLPASNLYRFSHLCGKKPGPNQPFKHYLVIYHELQKWSRFTLPCATICVGTVHNVHCFILLQPSKRKVTHNLITLLPLHSMRCRLKINSKCLKQLTITTKTSQI